MWIRCTCTNLTQESWQSVPRVSSDDLDAQASSWTNDSLADALQGYPFKGRVLGLYLGYLIDMLEGQLAHCLMAWGWSVEQTAWNLLSNEVTWSICCTWFGGSLLNASSCFQEVGGGRGGGDEGERAVRLWVCARVFVLYLYHTTVRNRLTLMVILTGIGIPSLMSLVRSLNSLQKTPIFTPLCRAIKQHHETLHNISRLPSYLSKCWSKGRGGRGLPGWNVHSQSA